MDPIKCEKCGEEDFIMVYNFKPRIYRRAIKDDEIHIQSFGKWACKKCGAELKLNQPTYTELHWKW